MPLNQTPSRPTAPAVEMSRLMDGYLTTQLLYVAARLGIAEALGDGPRTAGALAEAVAADPDALHRVLRGLAAEGVVEEHAGGEFGLTALGACLRADEPSSLRGAVIARGDLYYRAAGTLLDAVRAGDVPFERAYGDPFFAYVARHPDRVREFQASMTDRSRREASAVVAAYRFDRFRRIVDVGGGSGVLLAEILGATPRLHGILFDRPEVVERARDRFEANGLVGRYDVVGGDFFRSVPPGGDAYLLSRVVHDWDDDAALRILASCHLAMADGATLLLVEGILPESARDDPAAIRMDLHMLTLATGRERTEAEFEALLSRAGFTMTHVVPTPPPAGVCIIEAIRDATIAGRSSSETLAT